MGAHRTDMHRLQELVRLCRLGRSRRDIARLLGMGRDTIATYRGALEKAGLLDGDAAQLPPFDALKEAVTANAPPAPPPPQQRSSLERFRPDVDRLRKSGAGPTAIHDWLRLHQEGYAGSVSAVKRLVARLARADGVCPEDVAIAVETVPGEVAQVDFGYAGTRLDPATGERRKTWLFVMTLGFSRHTFAELVFDQTVETWVRMHVRAFEYFESVPRVIVPDNLKAAVIRAAFGASDTAVLHRTYRELARHYGFQIDPTPPRSPEKKGKVERGVGYIRRNFLATHDPKEFDAEQTRAALARWLREVAGTRRHAVTGRAPAELFAERELAAMLPLPRTAYEVVLWRDARVQRDVHVQVEGAFYSVPWPHMGQAVKVRLTRATVTIFLADAVVATHARASRGRRVTVEAHLPEHRGDLRHRSIEHWLVRAARVGPAVRGLVDDIVGDDDVLSPLRRVQAVVALLEAQPRERAERTADRARHFGCHDARGIRGILTRDLDLAAPVAAETEPGWMTGARFARRPASPTTES